MTFSEMGQAVEEAQATIRKADNYIGTMAGMISGRLRSGKVSNYTLSQLKRELRGYNIHTSRWSDDGHK